MSVLRLGLAASLIAAPMIFGSALPALAKGRVCGTRDLPDAEKTKVEKELTKLRGQLGRNVPEGSDVELLRVPAKP